MSYMCYKPQTGPEPLSGFNIWILETELPRKTICTQREIIKQAFEIYVNECLLTFGASVSGVPLLRSNLSPGNSFREILMCGTPKMSYRACQ